MLNFSRFRFPLICQHSVSVNPLAAQAQAESKRGGAKIQKGMLPLILPLSIVITLGISSCSQTKLTECKNIIAITQNIAEKSKLNRKTKDKQAVLKVADAFDKAARDMEKLNLEDKQLSEYQKGFAETYRNNAQATRDFVAALENKDAAAARANQKKVRQTGKQEKKLVSEMNSYCQESQQ